MTIDRVPPLRIAVLGCGNIGSTFAFQLSRAGHDVTAVVRPGSPRLGQLQRDAAIVDVHDVRANVRVAGELDGEVAYDLLIVILLAHQVATVMLALRASKARCVHFMFNTFDPESPCQAVGVGRCSLGMPFLQAKIEVDGRIKATIGAGGKKTLLGEQRWVDLFNEAGLPAKLERDMPLWLRCHAPMCVAFESVCIAGMRRGGGASWREAVVLARGVHAGFRLVEALGHSIYPQSKRLIDKAPTPVVAAMLWSMSRVRSFRELLSTGQAEACALVDTMIAAGSPSGAAIHVAAIEAMKPASIQAG